MAAQKSFKRVSLYSVKHKPGHKQGVLKSTAFTRFNRGMVAF